jgi:quinol monooxygenase YgiN
MLVQSIHVTFAAEHAEQAESFLRELRDESRKEDGVISFDVGRSNDKANGTLSTARDPWRSTDREATLCRDRLSNILTLR